MSTANCSSPRSCQKLNEQQVLSMVTQKEHKYDDLEEFEISKEEMIYQLEIMQNQMNENAKQLRIYFPIVSNFNAGEFETMAKVTGFWIDEIRKTEYIQRKLKCQNIKIDLNKPI